MGAGSVWPALADNAHGWIQYTAEYHPNAHVYRRAMGKGGIGDRFYASVLSDSEVGDILSYSKGVESDREGTIKHASLRPEGMELAAMDSALVQGFAFNEAVSFVVHCEMQDEIDYYRELLSADPG